MQSIRQKREQMIKQVRSRQRAQKLGQNRDHFFGHIDRNESLLAVIFFMLDQEFPQNLSSTDENLQETFTTISELKDFQNSFDDFLDLVAHEVRDCDEEDSKFNNQLKQEIQKRYHQRMTAFEELVLNTNTLRKIDLIEQKQNEKMFNLVRFLFRIQVVNQKHLDLWNLFLESCNQRMIELCNSDYVEKKNEYFVEELIKLVSLKIKLFKELFNLYLMLKQVIQKSTTMGQPSILKKEWQIVNNLCEKWIIRNLSFGFVFNSKVINRLNNEEQTQIKHLYELLQSFVWLYLDFIHMHDEMMTQLFDPSFLKTFPQKVFQLIFFMLFGLNSSFSSQERSEKSQKQTENNQNRFNEKENQLMMFIDFSIEVIKKIQKIKEPSQLLGSILKILVDCFIQLPKIVVNDSLKTIKIIESQKRLQIEECSKFFVTQALCAKEPLIVSLFLMIEDMEFTNLVNFVELLSVIVSYNEKAIEVLFGIPNFEGYYGKVNNFEDILKKRLINHVSIQIRRRGLWLLENIAGSEEFYHYAWNFIRDFFDQNVFEQDFTSTGITKEDLLIREMQINVIMNFLSNLRNYNELEEMMELKRKNSQSKEIESEQIKSDESMLKWVMRILAEDVKRISENRIANEGQKFIEVLIYSLYQILTLELSRKKQQSSTQTVIFYMMQQLEIPKNLETIYLDGGNTHRDSRYLTMLETLLDQIQKAKQIEQ